MHPSVQPDPLGDPVYRFYSPSLDAWWHGVRWDMCSMAMRVFGDHLLQMELWRLPDVEFMLADGDLVLVAEDGSMVGEIVPAGEPVQMQLF